jgi:DNA-binding NarL/FixJ family response regulator
VITVAIVNDYDVIVRGVAALLAPYHDKLRVVELRLDGEPRHQADVALFDTFASRRDALERARELVTIGTVGRVVLYTWDASSEFLQTARAAGVAGVVLKSQAGDGLADAILRVCAGEWIGFDNPSRGRSAATSTLTDRELEVLALIALGYSNREIAHELFLSVDTIKTHVRKLFDKLGVRNRAQAALAAPGHMLPPPRRRMGPANVKRNGESRRHRAAESEPQSALASA